LESEIGSGAIVSFAKDNHFREAKFEQGVLMISLTEQDGGDFLVLSDVEIMKRVEEVSRVSVSLIHSNAEVAAEEENRLFDAAKLIEVEPEENENTALCGERYQGKVTTIGEKEKVKVDLEVLHQPMKILFGYAVGSREPLYWYPTNTSKIMHTNTGIIGTMGTGKTQFTKSLIKQIYDNYCYNVNGTPIGILIFDYKGDYIKGDFVDSTHAKDYQPYHLPFNPLALFQGKDFKPLLPLHMAGMITETISTAFNLGVKQKQLLRDLIMQAYEEKGINKANPSTWNLVPPTIYDVYQKFEEHVNAKEDSLSAALKQITEYELFSPDGEHTGTLFDMIQGVTVINLSGYDPNLQNLIVGITLDTFYTQMQSVGHSTIQGDFRELTRMILVDEADNFLSKDFASLKKIMKEGREFGVGTILSTQFMSHFVTNDNDYSQYILTWIVHKVSEIKKKEVQSIFNTESQQEVEQVMNKIRELPKHHSLVTSVSKQKYVLMEDLPSWMLIQNRS
jgi:DNA phosphorothioation-dependent restriction protein DptH